jgi:diguanylate cyclase
VSGGNDSLNRSIDDILQARGKLTPHDISAIFDEFIAPGQIDQRLEEINEKIGDEIDQTMTILSESAESNKVFSDALSRSQSELSKSDGSQNVGSIVARLTSATNKADAVNRRLAQQLQDARQHIFDLQQNLDAVRSESLTDDLTTLSNRKHFDLSLARLAQDAQKNSQSFALLMTDIDHFKRFNDTYGHQTGDQVLRLVALSLKQTIKGQDIACRYGGEEFAVILPQTRLQEAVVVAEHIRNAVMTKELVKRSTGENLGRITLSIGVSVWRTGDTTTALVARADKALYAAKRGGRNAVRRETDPDVAEDDKVA